MLPQSLQFLVQQLKGLPGIGEKSAMRLAYHIIRADKNFVNDLSTAIKEAKDKIVECELCRTFSETNPCAICSHPFRQNSICIVEKPQDFHAIENTGEYKGKYFVLHGTLNPIDGIGPEELRIDLLIKRIKEEHITEVIIATNPSTEGEATAHFLIDKLNNLEIKLTKIAYGLPMGGLLEYADKQTIGKALENRTPLK